MDIPATAATPQAAATRSRGSLTSDFDTFLTLMTTQLQHQDPLKPVDSTEYLSQLASFSTVEQQSYTNNLLETLIASFGGMGLSQAAAWVGREARGIMPAHVAGPEAIRSSLRSLPRRTGRCWSSAMRRAMSSTESIWLWVRLNFPGSRRT
ncbi:flagellar hook capping FlgD N-terminal domain-containing protein [Gemmobacter lanyuensis]